MFQPVIKKCVYAAMLITEKNGWFWWKKTQARIWKIFFSNFQICHNQFFYLKTQPIGAWKLQCTQIFDTVLDIFAVCSLVPSMNLSHTQQSYLFPKNQNYLLEKAELRFLLNYGLRTTVKITVFSTFYVTDHFSSCYSRNSCKKIETFSIKLFSLG